MKAYYQSEDGKENIKSFLLPGDAIGSIKGFLGDNGCSFNLVCAEECKLTAIEFDRIREKSKGDLELANDCMKKGLEILATGNVIPDNNQVYSSDTQGQLDDLLVEFWNDLSMTTEDVQERYAEIIRWAD